MRSINSNIQNQLNIIRKVHIAKFLLICGDFTDDIGKLANSYEEVHGSHGYDSKNRNTTFAVAHNIAVKNSYITKKDNHWIM